MHLQYGGTDVLVTMENLTLRMSASESGSPPPFDFLFYLEKLNSSTAEDSHPDNMSNPFCKAHIHIF